MEAATLAILLILGFPLVIVAGFFLIWAVKIVTGKSGRSLEQTLTEETRLLQELHRGLKRMEERVEALENILFERERKEKRT